ncbi:MAG: hypothetical protein ACKO85_19135 [Isosphaeraceae bacterium]
MTIKGFIQSADLLQDPASEDRVMMIARVQGVGPGQPRKILIPFEILVAQEDLDPNTMAGRTFLGSYDQVIEGTALITYLEVGPGRVLRRPEG